MQRVMIFLDAEYVVQKMKEMHRKNVVGRKSINWQSIIDWIVNGRRLIRCYYYSAEFSKSENEKTYQDQHTYLKNLKFSIPCFEIKLGRLVRVNQGWVQKGLDVKIALDMFAKAVLDHYDTAALVSGDSDFIDVIKEVKERYGKHVELCTFDRSIHEALRFVPDRHLVVDKTIARRNRFFSL